MLKTAALVAGVLLIICISTTEAEVVIETVTVGNPGNAPDTRYYTPGYGGVDYVFDIGRFEVTAGQYTEFLNAVAGDDTYWLYDTHMWSNSHVCKIQRTGLSGSYSYSVAADWADRPVNYVSWGDAARFANWLHNGQPTGAQDLTTTEDGSYYLNGATSDAELMAVVRKSDATWVIPSEDEWYKAAYHYNDGVTGNYYAYPTSTNSTPSNDFIDPDPGNNATFFDGVLWDPASYTIGEPYYRTEVGSHDNSDSPYGAFDQGGNVWEWYEAIIFGLDRGVGGGSFGNNDSYLHAMSRYAGHGPSLEFFFVGFRVAEVSEPTSGIPTVSEWGLAAMALLLLAGTAIKFGRGVSVSPTQPATKQD